MMKYLLAELGHLLGWWFGYSSEKVLPPTQPPRSEMIHDEDYFKHFGDSVYITVTGPFSAGKTEFIRTISEIPVKCVGRHILKHPFWVKRKDRVWLDFGQVALDEHSQLFLFGTPGTRSPMAFVFQKEDLFWGFLGTIVVIDSARPETFRECRKFLNALRASNHPYVVALNPHYTEGWDLSDIQHALYKTSNENFIPCSALDKENVKQVILELLYQVRDSLEA